MRTTIIIDDELAERMRARAREKGLSLSAFIAEAGRSALSEKPSAQCEPFDLVTYGKAGMRPGINLDRTNELLAAEDQETYGR